LERRGKIKQFPLQSLLAKEGWKKIQDNLVVGRIASSSPLQRGELERELRFVVLRFEI
jgi:hypothetical protein